MVRETRDPREKRYCCHPKAFKRQMSYLRWAGYEVISLEQLVSRIISTNEVNQTSQQLHVTKPHKSVAITFDDGYADNYDNAFPVVKEYGFPATTFVVSDFVGRTNQWMEVQGFPKRSLLDWPAIKEMSANGMTIGSHTATHPSLPHTTPQSAKYEIVSSKSKLEDILGKPVDFFSYPHGLFTDRVRDLLLQAGYLAACSTDSGFNNRNEDPFALRRLEVYGTDPMWKFIVKLTFGTNEGTLALPLRYYYRRMLSKLALPARSAIP